MSELIRHILIFFILLPGIVAVLLMASGSYFGRGGSFSLTTSSIGLACLVIGLTFIFWIIPGSLLTYKYFFWINIGFCTVQWGFLIDSLSCLMLLIVSFISFLVHLYSIGYMYNDPHTNRFMAYLSLFTFFMFMLVTSDNLLQLFLGWEGVGLCSYLLVGFWYTRINANKAAIKALVINRMGDIALLIAMAIVYHQFKTLNFAVIFSICHYFESVTYLYFNYDWHVLSLISICLFLGAVGKSAQLGLHTWLPDAMEGPTPVSALIHAATMVTAGVFLLIRCSPLLEYAPTVLVFIALIGALTTFFAASVGIVQTDIKKIIAYSTCSQLGYMILACGLSNYILALYHLLTHAFFKALLFLSAGSIIHATGDEQDYRKMGGLVSFLPITYSTMLIGSCAIMGMPYLAGYYSKDLILEVNFLHDNLFNNFLQPLLILSTMLTIIYSLKLLFQAFLTVSNSYKYVYLHIHEPKIISFLLIPLIILSFCSIFSGYFFQEIFSVVGNGFFNNVITMKTVTFEMEFFDWEFKLYIFWLTFFLILWNVFYYIVFSSAADQAQKAVVKPVESMSTLTNDFKMLFSNRESFYIYNIKKKQELPLINLWLEFYMLRILFLPISIGYKWFSKEIPAIAYHHYSTNNTIIYSAEQVAFIVKRPIWQYQYPGFENEALFFNVRVLYEYFPTGSDVSGQKLVWYSLFLAQIKNRFVCILYNLLVLLWGGVIIKQLYHFYKIFIFEYLSLNTIYYLDQITNYTIYYLDQTTNLSFNGVISPLTKEDWLIVPVEFITTNIAEKVDFFVSLKLENMRLSYFWGELILKYKKTKELPLINLWLEFYMLRILFLPISIGYKWFSKEIPAIAYHHYSTNNTIIYSAEQVAFIVKRPIWQYQYPGFENEALFFNVRVSSWKDILEHVLELTIRELYNLLYCFSPEKYTFLQMLFFFTIQSESFYYFIGLIVINLSFTIWAMYINFGLYYIGTFALILYFVVLNAYSFIIRYIGWLSLPMSFTFVTFYHSAPIIFRMVIYSIFFETYYRNQFLYSIISYFVFYIHAVTLVWYALWDAILQFACDFFSQRLYFQRNFISGVYFNIITFLSKKWFFDVFQNKVVYFSLSKIYVYLYLLFEKGLFELFGPTGLTRLTTKLSDLVIDMHKTRISFFTLYMFYSVIILYFVICYIQ